MRDSWKRYLWPVGLLVVIAIVSLLAGCRLPWQQQAGAPGPAGPSGPATPQYSDACPIDGVGANSADINRRPLAVMIENSPQARPQSGVADACVVYEGITEGGITRFLAVYLHGMPAVIGPVRSIRPHFLHLGREYDAALVHCGQSYEALQILATTPTIYNLDQMKYPKPFRRDHSRKAPHNLYTSAEKLRAFMVDKAWEGAVQTLPSFTGDAPLREGEPANTVDVDFHGAVRYRLRFTYDPQRNAYLREMDGKPHVDRETETPIAATNIIIERVAAALFPKDRYKTYDVQVTGSGEGQFISAGRQIPIRWEKDSETAITHYTDLQGKPLPFLHGQTWVELVPTNGKVIIDKPDAPPAATKTEKSRKSSARHRKPHVDTPPRM